MPVEDDACLYRALHCTTPQRTTRRCTSQPCRPQNTRAASLHPAGQATPATWPVPAATDGLAQDLRSPLLFSQTIAHRQNPASITCLATGRRRSP
jgi:hypothetical protein